MSATIKLRVWRAGHRVTQCSSRTENSCQTIQYWEVKKNEKLEKTKNEKLEKTKNKNKKLATLQLAEKKRVRKIDGRVNIGDVLVPC